MSVRRRLRQLERALGCEAMCSCGRWRVSYVDADWLPEEERHREPERCPVCGLPVPEVVVRYVHDWRGAAAG